MASQLDALYQAVTARGYVLAADLVFVDEGYSQPASTCVGLVIISNALQFFRFHLDPTRTIRMSKIGLSHSCLRSCNIQ